MPPLLKQFHKLVNSNEKVSIDKLNKRKVIFQRNTSQWKAENSR